MIRAVITPEIDVDGSSIVRTSMLDDRCGAPRIR